MAKNKLPKVLSREEISRLMAVPNLRYPTGLRNRVILQVLYRAGLRRSEVTNLSPADVNLEQMFLYIQDSKGGRDRYVPIDPETISWLKTNCLKFYHVKKFPVLWQFRIFVILQGYGTGLFSKCFTGQD